MVRIQSRRKEQLRAASLDRTAYCRRFCDGAFFQMVAAADLKERPRTETTAVKAFRPSWTDTSEARIRNASAREAGVDGGGIVLFRQCVYADT